MPTNYDANILHKLADTLYSQATSTEIVYTLAAGIAGYFVGNAATASISRGDSAGTVSLVVAGVAALLGFVAGRSKAFTLRAQAQQMLCQVAMERHLATLASKT